MVLFSSRGALLSRRSLGATFAIAALFGALSFAPAQAQTVSQAGSPDACVAKCTADREQCIASQSSDELCSYDLKVCTADCQKK